MRILVVEDEPILAITAAAVLESEGHDVVGPAYDTAQALALAACEALDLAFVDINLNGHDEGVQLARDLRSRFGVASVFVSGQTSSARANRNAALGLLKKPYEPEALAESAEVAKALLAGSRPPPPIVPAALEVF